MPRLSSHSTTWICILTVAIGVRLALGVWWQARLGPEKQFFFGDSQAYWVLGQAIARGDPYEYQSPDRRVFRTPGYPLTPLLFVLSAALLVLNTLVAQPMQAAIGLAVVVAGAPAFFLWRMRSRGASPEASGVSL